MRILLDTDIILDLFLERPEFVDNAAHIWQAHDAGYINAYVSAITPVNLFYIGRKLKGHANALQAVQELLAALQIAPVNQAVLEDGLSLGFKDFEDAVQHASAAASGLEAIITRNVEDYTSSQLPVFSPVNFINGHKQIFARITSHADRNE